jgi:hypothetical protein
VASAIDPKDRITYAVATDITGLSRSSMARLSGDGVFTRQGGTPEDRLSTWFSRSECEEFVLTRYRRGKSLQLLADHDRGRRAAGHRPTERSQGLTRR